jgi:hypothetical protein
MKSYGKEFGLKFASFTLLFIYSNFLLIGDLEGVV